MVEIPITTRCPHCGEELPGVMVPTEAWRIVELAVLLLEGKITPDEAMTKQAEVLK